MPVIYDGHGTFFSFANFPTLKFKEVSVKPPALIGGGPNDMTNMRNVKYRTKMPKKLKSMGPMNGTAQYDPSIYLDLWDMLNVNQLITIQFPDASKIMFWGWLDGFDPSEVKEGETPTGAFTVEASNLNASLVETGPSYAVS